MDIVAHDIEHYAEEHTTPEALHLVALADETRKVTALPQMMVGRLEGRFLKFLVGALGARRVLEVGTFTGYSALSMAEALPPDGCIVTCEIDETHAEIARRHIAASPYADRIEIRLGRAIDTIATLDGPFDFVFVDADKQSYLDYYEAVLPLLADDGLIAVDNVLWSGTVVRDDDQSPDRLAIVAFNDHVARDERVECVLLTVRDGVLLVRKRR